MTSTIQSGESRIFRTVQRQHVAELANITNSATSVSVHMSLDL